MDGGRLRLGGAYGPSGLGHDPIDGVARRVRLQTASVPFPVDDTRVVSVQEIICSERDPPPASTWLAAIFSIVEPNAPLPRVPPKSERSTCFVAVRRVHSPFAHPVVCPRR